MSNKKEMEKVINDDRINSIENIDNLIEENKELIERNLKLQELMDECISEIYNSIKDTAPELIDQEMADFDSKKSNNDDLFIKKSVAMFKKYLDHLNTSLIDLDNKNKAYKLEIDQYKEILDKVIVNTDENENENEKDPERNQKIVEKVMNNSNKNIINKSNEEIKSEDDEYTSIVKMPKYPTISPDNSNRQNTKGQVNINVNNPLLEPISSIYEDNEDIAIDNNKYHYDNKKLKEESIISNCNDYTVNPEKNNIVFNESNNFLNDNATGSFKHKHNQKGVSSSKNSESKDNLHIVSKINTKIDMSKLNKYNESSIERSNNNKTSNLNESQNVVKTDGTIVHNSDNNSLHTPLTNNLISNDKNPLSSAFYSKFNNPLEYKIILEKNWKKYSWYLMCPKSKVIDMKSYDIFDFSWIPVEFITEEDNFEVVYDEEYDDCFEPDINEANEKIRELIVYQEQMLVKLQELNGENENMKENMDNIIKAHNNKQTNYVSNEKYNLAVEKLAQMELENEKLNTELDAVTAKLKENNKSKSQVLTGNKTQEININRSGSGVIGLLNKEVKSKENINLSHNMDKNLMLDENDDIENLLQQTVSIFY